MARVTPLELGPPVGWPLKFRVSGPDPVEDARARACVRPGARPERQHAQHQLRLERAGQGHQGRGRPGPGAGARHQLAAALQQHQRRCSRARGSRSCATAPIWSTSSRGRCPRSARKLETLRNLMINALGRPQRAAGADRDAVLRARAAADLAPPAPADRHGAGRRRAGRRGDHGRAAARPARSPTSAPSCRPAIASCSAA